MKIHLFRVKVGIPGEKFLGKDHEGWEYTSHDLWKKKLVWKSAWKKIWVSDMKPHDDLHSNLTYDH